MTLASNPPIEIPLERLSLAQKWQVFDWLKSELAVEEIGPQEWHFDVLAERDVYKRQLQLHRPARRCRDLRLRRIRFLLLRHLHRRQRLRFDLPKRFRTRADRHRSRDSLSSGGEGGVGKGGHTEKCQNLAAGAKWLNDDVTEYLSLIHIYAGRRSADGG